MQIWGYNSIINDREFDCTSLSKDKSLPQMWSDEKSSENNGKGDNVLKKQGKKQPILRIIVAILIIVLAGVGSYQGSKAVFTHKFKKDKEEAEQKEKAETASKIKENYITAIRVGKLTSLRILNTKKNTMTFVLMRPDSDLFTYDEDGNGQKMEKVVNNIQNAYSVTIDAYEDYDEEAFTKLINESDSYSCNLPHALKFKDNNQMSVNLDAGEHVLNGIQTWGVVSGTTGEYGSQDDYLDDVTAVIKGYTEVLLDGADKDKMQDYAKTALSLCDSDKKVDDISNYFAYYASVKSDDVAVVTLEGKETSNGFEVDINKAKTALKNILDGKAATSTSKQSSTTKKKDKTATTEETSDKISSKGRNIYIRNAAYINGLATKWTRKLSEDGYDIGSADSYSETYDKTIIRVSQEGMGEDLKEKYFPDAEIKVGGVEDDADICIYLGKDADTL